MRYTQPYCPGSIALAVFCLCRVANILADDDAKGAESAQLTRQVRAIDGDVFPPQDRSARAAMLPDDIQRRRQAMNEQSLAEWSRIKRLADWVAYRQPRLARLGNSLGEFPDRSKLRGAESLGEIAGDGFVIEKLVYESRPGLFVTANLYRPDPPRQAMPGILISHSHHRPKVQGELQDMGMTWARLGCLVLVPDHLGHGERRQHPFSSAADYPQEFAVSRQDYYFRYDNGIELHLAGESLIGQFVHDLRRGVDVLLARDGIDPEKIILLGAVAGGGEPAAITAALDERIACVAPFNFGGPQMPGKRFPLPDDIEQTANYVGSGSWESTRNLQKSGSGGFLPWVIVASTAPRELIYAHEFVWDRERDPIWRRLQTIYDWYEASENLGFTHGRGDVTGRPPEATHCTHIGRPHREMIHPLLARWFEIPGSTEAEYSERVDEHELMCLPGDEAKKFDRRPLHKLLAEQTDKRLVKFRQHLDSLLRDDRRAELRHRWSDALGGADVDAPLKLAAPARVESRSGITVERFALRVEREIDVPCLLLRQAEAIENKRKTPVVVMVSQEGKQELLEARSEEIAELLGGGAALCLCDLRGTGETSPGDGRTRQSYATGLSSSELMLGGTLLGARLRDLRGVLAHLRSRDDVDAQHIAVWGDSLAPVNPPDANTAVPHGIEPRPHGSEPLGGTLALLASLYEDDLAAVVVHRGLRSYRAVLDSPFVYIPHDVVVPGLLECGDLDDLAAAAQPTPLLIGEQVDGQNRVVAKGSVKSTSWLLDKL